MPFDPTDPDQSAAVAAAVEAALAPVRTETAAKLAELAGKATAAETAATEARTALEAARAGGEATATELATLKAKVEAAEAKAATLEKAEQDRQAEADRAIVATVPESLRSLLTGRTGADLKAAADAINAQVQKPPAGRSQGDGGGAGPTPTPEMLKWAEQKFGAQAENLATNSPRELIDGYNLAHGVKA